ncbi:MAG: prolipoprotein diacylglyceryl transferase [Candidatus Methylopumilus sp.]|nr:prolipoprotein diacylglyceryl transferase [Candidatus Methylopumilus sp.]
MLIHPQINPTALQLGPFAIHWYGVMYLFAFISFIFLGKVQITYKPWFKWNQLMLDDAFFYGAIGVILGGRLGYILFYQSSYYLTHPVDIFAIWKGGMSFHGGFLGVLISMFFLAKKYKLSWWSITDFIAPLVPLGLFFGRIGNFINAELWGRPTHSSFGMIFPNVDNMSRHPSQLYESFFEGFVLFLILWVYSNKPRTQGKISSLFLIFYGLFRFCLEYTREPDIFLGLLWNNLSMGQLLSIPMILIGLYFFNHSNNSA